MTAHHRTPVLVRRRTAAATGVAAAVMLSGLTGLLLTPEHARAAVAVSDLASKPEQIASTQAIQSGQTVAIGAETTETSQVVANPDGSFTLTSNSLPVRVDHGSGWTPIDTTLAQNDDGTWSPRATAAQMRFSAGGTSPMVTFGSAAQHVSLSWPSELPAPTIEGDTAVYPAVFPGVDLRLTANSDSYSEVLVIANSIAASNPALTNLRLSAAAADLTLGLSDDGGVQAADSSGAVVFTASTPIMWDSHQDQALGSTPDASDPGSGTVTSLDLSLRPAGGGQTALAVTPPSAALTGPDVTYPLYIDPSMAGLKQNFLVVFSGQGDPLYNTTDNLKVGNCPQGNDPTCNNIGVGRSFFSLNTSTLTGRATKPKIFSASVQAYEIHNSAACTSEPVNLLTAGAFTSSTTWPGPASSTLQTVSSNLSDTCSSAQPGWIYFNNANVVAQVQAAANNNQTSMNFALMASNEGDQNQWKQFGSDSRTGDNYTAPGITVVYNFPPSPPTNLSVNNNVNCTGTPYTRDTVPTFHAQSQDNNPSPLQVGLSFQVWDTAQQNQLRYNNTPVVVPSNTLATWTVGTANANTSNPLSDGPYLLRVDAQNQAGDGSSSFSATYSPWWTFDVDHTPPPAPSLSTFDYPTDAWGAPQDAPGTITATAAGAAGFSYNYDGTEPSLTDTTCNYNVSWTSGTGGFVAASSSAATLTIPTGLSEGPHTLYIKSFDNAHNPSAESKYSFFVAHPGGGANSEGPTRFEGEDAAVSATTSSGASNATFSASSQQAIGFTESGGLWAGGAEEHLIANAAGDGKDTTASWSDANPSPPSPPAADIATEPSITFTLKPRLTAYYALGIQLTSANHFGILAFDLDDTAPTRYHPIEVNGRYVTANMCSATPAVHYVPLGGVMWTGLTTHTLTIRLIGRDKDSNPSSPCQTGYIYNGTYGGKSVSNVNDNGYSAGIDYITATAVDDIDEGDFSASLNNHGIGTDNTVQTRAPDFSFDSGYAGISEQSLSQAGFGSGRTVKIASTGATFTMPTISAAGNLDNVNAFGQTIDVDPVNGHLPTGNDVDLLVASSCGDFQSPQSGSVAISVNFNPNDPNSPDTRSQQRVVPMVPAWTSTPPSNLAAAPQDSENSFAPWAVAVGAATIDLGANNTPSSDHTAHLYDLHFPLVSAGTQISSITLPTVTSGFTCAGPSLHLLAAPSISS